MSMANEQGMYKSSVDTMKQGALAIKEFMEALLEFLAKRQQYASARALARCIKNGDGLSIYSVRGDCREEVIAELKRNNIPHIIQKGKDGSINVFIRNKDVDLCHAINSKILDVKSDYYQSVDIERLENSFYAYNRIPEEQKKIVQISGLDTDIASAIRNKSNDITKGFMVGIGDIDGDGRCDLSVYAGKAMTTNPEKHDFCRAVLAASLSLYGPNHDLKVKQIAADNKIRDDLARISAGEDETYENVFIAGAGDRRRFIEITEDDFQYYEMHPNKATGEMNQVMKFTCSKSDSNYNDELLKYCDIIQDKVLLSNMSELSAHLEGRTRINSDRPEKDQQQILISDAESRLTDKIDQMIRKKTDRENMPEEVLWDEDALRAKMNEYFEEVNRIMVAMKEGKVPDGYTQEDMQEIRSILDQAGVDMKDYDASQKFIKGVKFDIHQARSAAEIQHDKMQKQEQKEEKQRPDRGGDAR